MTACVHSESFSCALFPDLDLNSVCTLYITYIAVYIVAALIPPILQCFPQDKRGGGRFSGCTECKIVSGGLVHVHLYIPLLIESWMYIHVHVGQLRECVKNDFSKIYSCQNHPPPIS